MLLPLFLDLGQGALECEKIFYIYCLLQVLGLDLLDVGLFHFDFVGAIFGNDAFCRPGCLRKALAVHAGDIVAESVWGIGKQFNIHVSSPSLVISMFARKVGFFQCQVGRDVDWCPFFFVV